MMTTNTTQCMRIQIENIRMMRSKVKQRMRGLGLKTSWWWKKKTYENQDHEHHNNEEQNVWRLRSWTSWQGSKQSRIQGLGSWTSWWGTKQNAKMTWIKKITTMRNNENLLAAWCLSRCNKKQKYEYRNRNHCHHQQQQPQ